MCIIKTFQIGWWGQGEREAGLYLKIASQGSNVGLAPFS